MWTDFHAFACALALDMGKGVQRYFEEHNLGEVIGQRLPNSFGRAQLKAARYDVLPCLEQVASLRQDIVMAAPFPRDPSKSQLRNGLDVYICVCVVGMCVYVYGCFYVCR
jgi:hypothetical protein